MMRVSILLVIMISLASCGAAKEQASVSGIIVPGKYYNGDGLGVNIYIQINQDGTYDSKWRGCLGDYGKASGTWLVREGELIFEPNVEDGMLKGQLREMKVVIYKDKAGFVPKSDLEKHYKTLEEFGESFYVYMLQEP